MENIVITAVLRPKAGFKDQVLVELKKVQQASRVEEGCLRYDLHQSEEGLFVLYEVWHDQESLEKHTQSSHYQNYRDQIADLVSSRDVYKLKVIE